MSSSNLKKQTKKWVVWSQTLDPPVISPWQLKYLLPHTAVCSSTEGPAPALHPQEGHDEDEMQ